jgi:hypothetical protein
LFWWVIHLFIIFSDSCIHERICDQEPVIFRLILKWLSASQIYSELPTIYGQNPFILRIGAEWCSRSREDGTNLGDNAKSGRPRRNDLSSLFASVLHERAFLSWRVLSRDFRIATETCLWLSQAEL